MKADSYFYCQTHTDFANQQHNREITGRGGGAKYQKDCLVSPRYVDL